MLGTKDFGTLVSYYKIILYYHGNYAVAIGYTAVYNKQCLILILFRTDNCTGIPFQIIIFSFCEVLDMLQKTQSWKTQIFLFIEMLFGSILMAASFGLIIIPQEFSAGGVTGLAKVLQSVLPVNLSVLVFSLI